MNKKLNELIETMSKNPELPVIFMASNEICSNDDYRYFLCGISRIKIDSVWHKDEKICLDKDDIIEELCYFCESEYECEKMTDDEFDEFVKDKLEELENYNEIKKCIIVYLDI